MTVWTRLPLDGDASGELVFDTGELGEANALLAQHHYLGPTARAALVVVGLRAGTVVACQTWVENPSARLLPNDGTWLELTRWCLTPDSGPNAGSRQDAWARRRLRELFPRATTLVSYSDPSEGHDGALYRACNWLWAPTHHTLRYRLDGAGYPSGHGRWAPGAEQQAPKDRWVYPLRRDARRDELLRGTPIHPALRELAREAGLQ